MYVNKDVRLRGYILKSKGLSKQKRLGNTGLDH